MSEQLPPLVERLLAGCTDWDGSPMANEAPPMDCLTAGDAREAAAEIVRLRAELDALRRDAERYRWLRRDITSLADIRRMEDIVSTLCEENMDAAIDAAMKEAP